jgi:hypothetical protein
LISSILTGVIYQGCPYHQDLGLEVGPFTV